MLHTRDLFEARFLQLTLRLLEFNLVFSLTRLTLGHEHFQGLLLLLKLLLKESLRELLGRKQINVVEKMLKEWIAEAKASGLAAFAKLAGTLEKHFEGVVAYVKWNLTNGRVEGLNNKVRVLARRSYGFHSAEAALAMIMLCCTGLNIQPVLKLLTP